jgi:DNA polymerase-3 subunit delta'
MFHRSGEGISQLFSRSEKIAAEKEDLPELLDLLVTFLRDILHVLSGSHEIVNRDLLELVQRESMSRSPERVMEMIEQVIETRTSLRRNVNARLAVDVLLMRLAA